MGNSAPGRAGTGRWYFVVTVCSAGLLAWIPFVHARNHVRRRRTMTMLALGYAAAAVLIGVLVSLAPRDARGEVADDTVFSTLGGFVAIATVAVGCVQQASLRREVYGGAPPPNQEYVDPALAAALAARDRRVEARKLAAADPLLARDLKIGLPHLSRTYDDGGLVDLNSAPPQVIAETCGLPAATGEAIVEARPPGGYLAVDDVFALTDVPVAAWDSIRDRAVTIPRADREI